MILGLEWRPDVTVKTVQLYPASASFRKSMLFETRRDELRELDRQPHVWQPQQSQAGGR